MPQKKAQFFRKSNPNDEKTKSIFKNSWEHFLKFSLIA